MRAGWGVWIVAAVAACGGAPGDGTTVPVAVEPPGGADSRAACTLAVSLRARAGKLREEGKLDRSLRAVARANRMCPATEPESWAVEVRALIEVGRVAAAITLADRIDASDKAPINAKAAAGVARREALELGAPPTDLAAAERDAKKLFQEGLDLEKLDPKLAEARFAAAWKAKHPFGDALVHAGLAASAQNDPPRAQRYFDRALAELELASGKQAVADVPNGFDVGTAVAFAPDGERVALAHGSSVVLLGASTLDERLRLEGHTDRVAAVSFSPDGALLASASADQSLRVWDATTGQRVRDFVEFREAVDALAWSSDGKFLAAVSEDGWVQVWETTNWLPILRVDQKQPLFSVAFAPKTNRLAIGGLDGKIRILSLPKGEVATTLLGHKASVLSLTFSADGKRLASGSADKTVRTWDIATSKQSRALTGYASALSLSRNGKLVAFGTPEHSVAIYDADVGIPRGTLKGHADDVMAVAFSPDATKLLSCASDRVALLWDVGHGRTLSSIEGHARPLAGIAVSPQGDRIAAASRDQRVFVFGGSARGLVVHDVPANVTRAIAFSPDGKSIASAAGESPGKGPASGGVVELWDAESGKTRMTMTTHEGAVNYLAFDPSGRLLASASADKTVDLTDVATGKVERKLEKHKGAVNAVAFSRDGRFIATASSDFDARLWNARNGEADLELEHGYQYEVTGVAFSPDGQRLATAARGDTIGMWDTTNGHSLFTIAGPAGTARDVAFSRDGRFVATASRDGASRVYGAGSGKYVSRLSGSRAAAEGAAFVGTRNFLAVASGDGSVFMWDVETGALVATIRVVAGSQGGYVVSGDGFVDVIGERVADVTPICRVGAKSYPFVLCEDRLTSPGLLQKLLAGDPSYADP